MQKKAITAKPSSSTDIISRITSKLKRHRNKEGLYIICINATKLISPSELEQLKESAKTLTKFLLKDPNNWVGVYSLNDEFKYLDKSRFSQKFQQIEAHIKGIPQQQSNQPITILNSFAKAWKKDDKILRAFDTFVVVMSHIVFNPDQNLFKVFSNKKLHLVPCLFGENPVLCKDKTLKFATSHDLHTNFKSLITKAENLDCRVELTLEHYAVVVKFLANIDDPELEIRIIKKEEGHYQPIDAIFTNQKQLRIEKLEPGCQYIMKYRFYFSDGMNSAFFEEVHFQTLSQSIRDIELLKSDQAKSELTNVRENILSLSVSSIEKLMGIHSYNILLFGRIGAGKSSFASTLNRAGTGVFNPNFAYVDFSYKSCTKELNKLELYNCSPIRLWDTFGIDDKNYDHSLLEYILDGRVKDQYRPGDSLYSKEFKLGDSVHAVIIVIDVQMFPEQEELEKLRQKVNCIKDKKHYPILIITKLDTLNPKIGPTVSCKNMYNVKQSEEIIKRAHELFRIDKNNIFFMINYHGDEPQDVYKELIALRILNKSIERARQFIIQRKKILIKDVNGKGRKIIPLVRDDLSLAEFRDSYGIQITKMLKSEDFYFVEYPEDEEDYNLYEIDQIDEEHGEKIKFLNVAKRARETKTRHHHHRFEKSMSDSLNSRAEEEEYSGPITDHRFGDVELTYSQEISKHSKPSYKNKSKTPTGHRDSQDEQAREFNLEDSKSEYESVELSNGNPDKVYFQERYDDLVIEDLHSPYRSTGRKVIMVLNGEDEQELDEIDMSASLHKIRKRIAEQFPTFNEKNFAFAKSVEDKEIPIPAYYENESAIMLEQVMKPIGDSTAKFYIRTQK